VSWTLAGTYWFFLIQKNRLNKDFKFAKTNQFDAHSKSFMIAFDVNQATFSDRLGTTWSKRPTQRPEQ
jgi:hypothetical protein